MPHYITASLNNKVSIIKYGKYALDKIVLKIFT